MRKTNELDVRVIKIGGEDYVCLTDMAKLKSEGSRAASMASERTSAAKWPQGAMADLFGVQKAAISKHLKNIFESGELEEGVVVSKMETTTPHGAIAGKTQEHAVNFYNLDTIIAVGYRVNSRRATQFRIWATKVLREYIVKGFALDDNRLKCA